MSDFSLTEINDKIAKSSRFVDDLKNEMIQAIQGQDELVDKLIIAMLANGHILLEGVPGLAKTLMVNTLAKLIKTNFQRLQFTPDMLPADLLGTLIYNQKTQANYHQKCLSQFDFYSENILNHQYSFLE